MIKKIDIFKQKYIDEFYKDKEYKANYAQLLDPTNTSHYFMLNGYIEFIIKKLSKKYKFKQFVDNRYFLVRKKK